MRIQRTVLFFALVSTLLIVIFPGTGAATGYAEDGKLLPVVSGSGANVGQAVAIDGNTAVVAAPGEDLGLGAVHVFEWSDSGWQHKARLTVSNGVSGDWFGSSVAISGNVIVVGGSTDDNSSGTDAGTVYLYVKPAIGWEDMTESMELIADDAAEKRTFGTSVAIAGTTLVVGASGHESGNYSGAVYVFQGSGTNWTQVARLTASDGRNGDLLGFSLDLYEETIAAGAYGKAQKTGAVYVFRKPATGWRDANEDVILVAQDHSAGDQFGYGLAIDGEHILVGADRDDDSGEDGGAVYLFSGADWSQQKKFVPEDGFDDQGFGYAVDIFGGTAIVGALLDDDKGKNSGSVYVYEVSSGALTYREKLVASDGDAEDRFGSSVAMTGGKFLIGAYTDTVEGEQNSGSAYVFNLSVDGNMPPQAQNDSFETEEGIPLTTSNVLANDSDPDGDVLSISGVDNHSVKNGALVDNGNGTFTYTPPTSYTGADSFKYSISDGRGGEAQGTVLITVRAASPATGDGGGGGGALNFWLLLWIAGICRAFLPKKQVVGRRG